MSKSWTGANSRRNIINNLHHDISIQFPSIHPFPGASALAPFSNIPSCCQKVSSRSGLITRLTQDQQEITTVCSPAVLGRISLNPFIVIGSKPAPEGIVCILAMLHITWPSLEPRVQQSRMSLTELECTDAGWHDQEGALTTELSC